MSNLISEEDFENSSESSPGIGPSPIDEKHAYKKVVVPSSISDPSGSKVIEASPSDVILKPSPSSVILEGGVAVENGGVESGGVKNIDKINNLVQKEVALGRVGVTREKAYRVIASALDAKKWMDVIDRQGNVKQEYVDDLEKQRWGAEMAIKMFGDMIERKEIEHDIGDRTLDKFRAMSVSELKTRAADLLLGKTKVIDAEVVK